MRKPLAGTEADLPGGYEDTQPAKRRCLPRYECTEGYTQDERVSEDASTIVRAASGEVVRRRDCGDESGRSFKEGVVAELIIVCGHPSYHSRLV